ncbi:MAG TPA: carboxypeptidase regulatory-like domain-containing protein [Candidatus Aquilonibacter sp.]|nr:carboxypeptidase regulatory-like domain-containing protein [Candidatus Aquilonibacter sp.]
MRKITFIAIVILCLGSYAPCQETRATLTGFVTDSTGAAIPGAAITVVNTATGATVHVKSNGQGTYTVPFLQPGPYKISAQMNGFKAYVHSGLELQVDATVKENIVLQVGSVAESVVVTSATPLIDTSNADTGQSLSREEVIDLPNNGNSAFALERDEYGVIPVGAQATAQITPTSNTSASQVSIGGGQSASAEVLLNGIPDMESSSRQISYFPMLDSVDTVHVDQFSANAALGDTIGGTVNITTKSGTNEFHGTLTEYYNGSRPFEAKPYFTAPGATLASSHYNQPGATIGGPVWIPHLFNGHNKLFFFFAWEGFYTNSASPVISSVPTADERNGDFHSVLAADGASAQLYDPYSGSNQTIGSGQYWIRPAIPNNCLAAITSYCSQNAHNTDPNLTMSPIAQKYLALLPMPNYSGSSTKADGENNFISYPQNSNVYNSYMTRIDWNISDTDKIFGELHQSYYNDISNNYYANPLMSGSKATFQQPGGQIDNVKTFSQSTSLETRLGFQRYYQINSPLSLNTSPTTFGFPGYIAANSGSLAVPYVTFSDGASIEPFSQQTNGYGIIDYLTGYAVLNKTIGRHSIKVGIDARTWKKSGFSPMEASGNFAFAASTNGFFAESPNYNLDEIKQPFGSSFAMLDAGLPSSGTYQITQKFQYDNWYEAYFLQDDWKATKQLTLSLGLRLDHETAVVESNNRMLQNFYPNQPNTTSSAASAAYASQYAGDVALLGSNPSYLPSPSSLNTNGATVYETSGNRDPYHPAPLYVSPRIGFAYAPAAFNNKLVIRGGFSIMNQPFGTYTAQATTGYSQVTSMVLSNSSVNGGYSPITTWENPFPETAGQVNYNPIAQPVGSAYGADAALGSGPFFFPQVKVPYTEKFSLDVQKQFGHNWMVEIGGLHSLSLHNSAYLAVNNFPYLPYLVHAPNNQGASAVSNAMAVQVTNPFYHLFPTFTSTSGASVPNTTALNTNPKVAVSQLATANPEFTGVTEFYAPATTINFNALTARVEKRMGNGLEMNANFEWSRQLGNTVQINPNQWWYGETTSDFPIHVAITSIYELPFGKNRPFMTHANPVVEAVAGGWKVSGEYQYLSGSPISWGNVDYLGTTFNDFNMHPHVTNAPAFNTSIFDKVAADQPGSWNYRTFPEYFLRTDPTNNFNFSALKDFFLYERYILSFRVDAFNALNHAQLSGPNVSPTSSTFGYITGQSNKSRTLAGGLHLRF